MLQRMLIALGTVLILCFGGPDSRVSFSGHVSAAQKADGNLKFEIYQDASKEYRWRLKGGDDKLLATAGQGFSAKADVRKSVDRIINNLEKQKFEIYQDKGKEFRWRLKASNGQVVAASSGGYATKADVEK